MIEATNFIEQIINEDLETGKTTAIQTRFPPEPNGYLHIGHAKSMFVNFGIANKYDGKCNLFFDDTNPSKEKTEFVDAIRADIRWMGYEWAKECYASDFFQTKTAPRKGAVIFMRLFPRTQRSKEILHP